jgi:hypothetical protein
MTTRCNQRIQNTQEDKIMKAKLISIGLRVALALGMGLAAANSLTHPSLAEEDIPNTTPIIGGSGFATAVVVSPDIEYSGTVSGTHTNEYFYFDVSPGQIATIAFTSTTTWGGGASFRLWDQNHVNAFKSLYVGGASQANQFLYVGNSTTPSRYYFQAQVNGATSNAYLFQISIADQTDGNMTGDAGDTAPAARIITPTLDSITTYSSTMGNVDNLDWFRINAASGQIISVTVRVLDYGGATTLSPYLADQASVGLATASINTPDTTPRTLEWMSNNTAPSAYLLRLTSSANNGQPMRYRFDVELHQQNDANTAGDAGDDFDAARVVTLTKASPTLDAPGNLLGAADDNDYLLIKLPEVGIGESIPRYRIFITPLAWPGPSGYLKVQFYDAQRNPINSLGGTINAPSTSPYNAEITRCASNGCYVRLSSGFSGYNPIRYAVRVVPIVYVYLPFLVK